MCLCISRCMGKLLICQILANVVVINVHHTNQIINGIHLLKQDKLTWLLLEIFLVKHFLLNSRKYIMHKHSAFLFPYMVVLALYVEISMCLYCQIGIIAYFYVFPLGGQNLDYVCLMVKN